MDDRRFRKRVVFLILYLAFDILPVNVDELDRKIGEDPFELQPYILKSIACAADLFSKTTERQYFLG